MESPWSPQAKVDPPVGAPGLPPLRAFDEDAHEEEDSFDRAYEQAEQHMQAKSEWSPSSFPDSSFAALQRCGSADCDMSFSSYDGPIVGEEWARLQGEDSDGFEL